MKDWGLDAVIRERSQKAAELAQIDEEIARRGAPTADEIDDMVSLLNAIRRIPEERRLNAMARVIDACCRTDWTLDPKKVRP